jgi:hypothetical protein
MERSAIREQPLQVIGWSEKICKEDIIAGLTPDYAEFTVGPAQRVRPSAGPTASSGRTRWLHPGYERYLHSVFITSLSEEGRMG